MNTNTHTHTRALTKYIDLFWAPDGGNKLNGCADEKFKIVQGTRKDTPMLAHALAGCFSLAGRLVG